MGACLLNCDGYHAFHEKLCDEARELSRKKNHDYAGKDGENPFRNFERVEAMGVASTERGFLVRMIDKLSRLSGYCEAGEFKVSEESFQDSCVDLINYTCLLAAYVSSKGELGEDTR